MIPETENPQEAKRVYPGKLARHALVDPDRYITHSPQCCFSRGAAQKIDNIEVTAQHTFKQRIYQEK